MYPPYIPTRLTDCNPHRIHNPLVDLSRAELLADVETFATRYGLTDELPLLRKGALVAQSPRAIDSIPELDEADRQALRDEVDFRWKQPKMLYFTIILCSIAAAIQGWDQTGSNGANLGFPEEFGIPDAVPGPCEQTGNCDTNSWLVGLVNASPYICIAFL